MSKLCQCRLEKLEKKYWEHVEECSLMDCVAEGNMILIQDCVCEKKEIFKNPCFFCPYVASSEDRNESTTLIVSHNRVCKNRKVRLCEPGNHNYQPTGVTLLSSPPLYPHQCTNCGDVKNFERPVVAEKQSQSPCEKWNHSFIENKLEGRTPSLQKLPSGEYMYVKRQITLWTCRECGLVTCVDPSRSAPSKNPNN